MPRPVSVSAPPAPRSAAARPGAADVARHLRLIVHDLRGPATALQAYARFLDEQLRCDLDPAALSWLDAFQANAELTGHLCEALCILEGTSLRSGAPIRDIVEQSCGRLQKLLARGPLALKVSGVFPDRKAERRRLGFVVEAILAAAAVESAPGHPANLEWSAEEREERIVVTLAFEPGLFDGLSELPARLRGGHPAGLSELALAAALSDLDAEFGEPLPGMVRIVLPATDGVTWS